MFYFSLANIIDMFDFNLTKHMNQLKWVLTEKIIYLIKSLRHLNILTVLLKNQLCKASH